MILTRNEPHRQEILFSTQAELERHLAGTLLPYAACRLQAGLYSSIAPCLSSLQCWLTGGSGAPGPGVA